MRAPCSAIVCAALASSVVAAPQVGDGERPWGASAPVLDPIGANFLIGALSPAATPSPFGRKTAVAYDPVSQRYLVVWDCAFHSAENGCHTGKVVLAADGSPVSGVIHGAFGYDGDPDATVAGTATSWFVLVTIGGDIVDVNTKVHRIEVQGGFGGVFATVQSGAPLSDHRDPDVGGGFGADDVIVVFDELGGVIRAEEFDLISMRTTKDVVVSGFNSDRPAIASLGGAFGRYLITWDIDGGARIEGMVVSRDLEILVPTFTIATGPLVARADVDGDGSRWVVAYERSTGGGLPDVVCRSVAYSASTGTVSLSDEVVVAGDPGVAESAPAVAGGDESFLVGYLRDFGGGDFDVWVKSVHAHLCVVCEGDFQLSTSADPEQGIGIATRNPGPGASGEALITWISDGVERPVRGRLYRADDGLVTRLAGGCSGGGEASATCAAVGQGAFSLRTQSAAPSTAGALLLGGSVISVPCGLCTLVTNPLVTVPASTDASGTAQVDIQITDPALAGVQLVAQWVLAANGGCASVLSLSNGLQVTIQ
jgi:hypothetical protein